MTAKDDERKLKGFGLIKIAETKEPVVITRIETMTIHSND